MRLRRLVVITAAAASLAVATPALAYSPGLNPGKDAGNSANAPGQANAIENCTDTALRQYDQGLEPGGGPKHDPLGFGAQGATNCDHYFQYLGLIGNQPGL
jgi:hypothetical protein